MEDLYNAVRADKDFNLETVPYEELFEGLKFAMADAIRDCYGCYVDAGDLSLDPNRCARKRAYGQDGNLYPKIYLYLVGGYSFIISPFEIEMVVITNKIRTYSSIDLTESLYAFMCCRFAGVDYEKKFQKYFEDAEKIRQAGDGYFNID